MIRNFVCTIMMIFSSISGFSQDLNPFFHEWETPFGVPPFEQIQNTDYMPAFLEGIRQHQEEIKAITANPDPPSFENTILAFDQSGTLLEKVSYVFYGLNSANTDKEKQNIAKQLSPLMTKHGDDISLNPDLFIRVKSIYEKRNDLNLDPDQKRLVEEMYKDFVRGGANVS